MSPSQNPLNLEQIKRQAKELRQAHGAGEAAVVARIKNHLPRLQTATDREVRAHALSLREAQLVLAREHGFGSWKRLLQQLSRAPTATASAPQMDPQKARKLRDIFINKAFGHGEPFRPLTNIELQFIEAAADPGDNRWEGRCDVARMEELVVQAPDLLVSIGPALLRMAVSMRGCHLATHFLAQRGVLLEIDESEYNAVHEAAWAGATENMRAVFAAGTADAAMVALHKAHVGWYDNCSLMYWAALRGDVEMAKLLIEYGVGVHHELAIKGNGERGTTVLQEAVAFSHSEVENQERAQGKQEVARLLIGDGAQYDINSACGLGDQQRLEEVLADNGLLVNAADAYGMTPLHWAARAGSLNCARLLLERGAEPDAANRAGRVPLHLAADANGEEMVWLLADWGADLDVPDKQGRTPLHRATHGGCAETAEILIALGGNSRLKNKKGKTPLQVARMGASFLKN